MMVKRRDLMVSRIADHPTQRFYVLRGDENRVGSQHGGAFDWHTGKAQHDEYHEHDPGARRLKPNGQQHSLVEPNVTGISGSRASYPFGCGNPAR